MISMYYVHYTIAIILIAHLFKRGFLLYFPSGNQENICYKNETLNSNVSKRSTNHNNWIQVKTRFALKSWTQVKFKLTFELGASLLLLFILNIHFSPTFLVDLVTY